MQLDVACTAALRLFGKNIHSISNKFPTMLVLQTDTTSSKNVSNGSRDSSTWYYATERVLYCIGAILAGIKIGQIFRFGPIVTLVATAAFTPCLSATLDQQSDPSDANLGSYFFFKDREWGQTFTAGLSGKLDSVDLGIEIRGGTIGEIWIDLYSYQTGTLGTYLAQSSLLAAENLITVGPGSAQRVIANFDFSGEHVGLVAGTKYSLAVRTGITDNFRVSWNIAPLYSRGEAFKVDSNVGILTPSDFSFATYVEQLPGCIPSGNIPPKCDDISPVPTPDTMPLLAAGVVSLAFWRRKRKPSV